jgi:hypothetical protein
MNNPLRILQTLDRHLTQAAEMTLFGRAALALGYPDAPAAFGATQDADAILPLSWLAAEDEHWDFWPAQQRTNAELKPEGLYLTHLFRELEVILTPDWLKSRVRIANAFQRLSVFRPSTLDLILTKMARGDENDLADIRFLLQHKPMTTTCCLRPSIAPEFLTCRKSATFFSPLNPKCSHWQKTCNAI